MNFQITRLTGSSFPRVLLSIFFLGATLFASPDHNNNIRSNLDKENIDYCHSTDTSQRNLATTTTTTTTTTAFQVGNSNSIKNRQLEGSSQEGNEAKNVMRAWNCHGRNQKDLVDRLVAAGIVRSEKVREVLYQVDRQQYVPFQSRQEPYIDAPQVIGLGQTISAPHMHAHVLEEILPFLDKKNMNRNKDGDIDDTVKILDVGCGSGYLTAAFGRWVAPPKVQDEGERKSSLPILGRTGQVYGIDVLPKLVEFTRQNMEKCDGDLLSSGIVTLKVGNGWEGLSEASPFDVIHVGAAASDFPIPLLQQLKVGGVLIIPVGPQGSVQNLYKVERTQNRTTTTSNNNNQLNQEDFKITQLLGVRYVPLVNPKDNDKDRKE